MCFSDALSLQDLSLNLVSIAVCPPLVCPLVDLGVQCSVSPSIQLSALIPSRCTSSCSQSADKPKIHQQSEIQYTMFVQRQSVAMVRAQARGDTHGEEGSTELSAANRLSHSCTFPICFFFHKDCTFNLHPCCLPN